ncbi:esterase/lipase family protein [Streptomyces rishiriensis]|uniref:esterase/lipase family protein n=1 Tax=Streptomyces rishiriensis TaxID=68264 RepID=UPI0037911216
MEDAAQDLLRLIERLQAKTKAPRVHLVAHSMGGLVCRCLLQKILPELERAPVDYVDKLFTYGTPHGGITFDIGFGLLEKLRDAIGINGADIFGPRRMYEYLTPKAALDASPDGPPPGWSAREIPEGEGSFPLPRIFCLVGTDPKDYEVALGLSSFAVGARSDGLVQIDNAYVPGAHRAYVHRSHSGRYGLVNSEEGYQNLRRFLFGDTRVEAALVDYVLPSERGHVSWQAEVMFMVRGLPVVMHERQASTWCPVPLPALDIDGRPGAPVTLATTFLRSDIARPAGSSTMRYALHVRILSLRSHDEKLRFTDHLEQTADFSDVLIIDIGTSDTGRPGVWADWNSVILGTIRDHRPTGAPRSAEDEDPQSGVWRAHIPLPATARPILGERASIRLTATPWE